MTSMTDRWILMRGLTRECRHWGGFTELLAQLLPHSSIQCIDLPGNGALCNESSPDEIADITDRVRAQNSVRQPVRLLGLSMGGMIACDWALRYPDEVQGMVLINSSLAELSPVWQRIRWQVWWPVLGAFLATRERREKLIYRLTCNVREDHETILEQWLRFQRESPVRRRNFLCQLRAAAHYRLPCRGNHLTKSALILAAAEDHLVDPLCSQHLASAFGAELHLHPAGGHDLAHDDPIWVVQRIAEWLSWSETQPLPLSGQR